MDNGIDPRFYISPRFWAAALAIVFVLLGAYAPSIAVKLDAMAVTSAVVALVSFIAAASVSSGPSYVGLFTSVKFWALVVSLVFVFLRAFVPSLPISEALVQELVAALGVISVGYSYRPLNSFR